MPSSSPVEVEVAVAAEEDAEVDAEEEVEEEDASQPSDALSSRSMFQPSNFLLHHHHHAVADADADVRRELPARTPSALIQNSERLFST